MKPAVKTLIVVASAFVVSACVAGSAEASHAASNGMLSQFALGLWHGVAAPVTLILEVLEKVRPGLLPWKVHIYEVTAQGLAYDLGFYLGIAGSPVVVWSRRR